MSGTYSSRPAGGAGLALASAAGGIADGLRLAAAPTFAIMALAMAMSGPSAMLCAPAPAPLLGGMAPMYLLMSVFHSAPWLKLISNRRRPISHHQEKRMQG